MVRKLALPLLAAIAACGGAPSVSFSARSGSSAAAVRAPSSGSDALTLGSGVQLTRIRVCIRDIKLETKATGGEEHEFKTGPVVIDLAGTALDGGTVVPVTSADVQAGTYEEIKLKIHKPSADESSSADVKAMADANASIIVDGTIDGATFTFTSAVEVEQEFEHSVTVKDGSNLTLNLDPTAWFGATAAARLDPRVSGNRSQIESNIRASFKVVGDDDRDGHDDDGEHAGRD